MKRKVLFDAIRRLFGSLNQSQVNEIDLAIDNMITGAQPTLPLGLTTSKKGIELIHSFEDYAVELPNGDCRAYPDPATGGAPWTIGWGSTTDEEGKPIKPGTVWTKARADARFTRHLRQFEQEVRDIIKDSPTTQNQFDALVSFAYNIGSDDLKTSTLMRKHLKRDYAGAAAEFVRWNRANGKVMRGLTRRRIAEADMYLGK